MQKGGPEQIFCAEFFMHQSPLTSVCEWSLINLPPPPKKKKCVTTGDQGLYQHLSLVAAQHLIAPPTSSHL